VGDRIMKRLIELFVIILVIQTSCTDIIEPDYSNINDHKSPNYIPSAPTDITLTYSFKPIGIIVEWVDNSLGEVGFEIERKDSINNIFQKVGVVSSDSILFLDRFIPALNTKYMYRIKAIGPNGKFTFSSTQEYVNNVLNAPTNLIINHFNKSTLELSWIAQNTFEDSFYINMRTLDNQNNNFQRIAGVDKNTKNFVVENLDTNKIYEFSITALNSYYQINSDTISVIYGLKGEETKNFATNIETPIDFSPISNILAMGAYTTNEKIKLYNYDNSNLIETNFTQYFVNFLDNGTQLALLDDNLNGYNFINIINTNTLEIEKQVPYRGTRFAINHNENKLVLDSESEAKLRLIDLNSLSIDWEIPTTGFYDIIFNQAGDKIIYNDSYSRISFLNVTDGSSYNSIITQGGYVSDFAITSDDRYLCVVAPVTQYLKFGCLEIWDLQTLTLVKKLGFGNHLAISPDNKLLIISSEQGNEIYRFSDFEKVGKNIIDDTQIKSICFNYQSNLIGVSVYSSPTKIIKLVNRWILRD
jgi:hypothetical protein